MTTVTTTAVAMTVAGQGLLALIVTIVLIGLLVLKDLVDARQGVRARRGSRLLMVAILPLLTVFVIDVVQRAIAVLQ